MCGSRSGSVRSGGRLRPSSGGACYDSTSVGARTLTVASAPPVHSSCAPLSWKHRQRTSEHALTCSLCSSASPVGSLPALSDITRSSASAHSALLVSVQYTKPKDMCQASPQVLTILWRRLCHRSTQLLCWLPYALFSPSWFAV